MLASLVPSRGDLFGGISAGIVALPLCLAFGAISGLGPEAGLYGAIAAGILAAIFGGSQVLVTGPTNPMTLVAATVVAANTPPGGTINLPVVMTAFLLAGALQVLLGVLRLGGFVRYVPYPVISGFMSGIGVIIIIQQLYPIVGAEAPSSNAVAILGSLSMLPGKHPVARRAARPGDLCDPSTSAAVHAEGAGLAGCADRGDRHLGCPGGRRAADWRHSRRAAGIGGSGPDIRPSPARRVGGGSARAARCNRHAAERAARRQPHQISPRQQPGAHRPGDRQHGRGSGRRPTGRRRKHPDHRQHRSGRQDPAVRGDPWAVPACCAARAFRPGQYIPNAVLAGILVGAGLGCIDFRGLSHIAKVPRSDAAVLVIVFALTVFAGLIVAVAVGLVIASFVFMKKVADICERQTAISLLADEPWADEIDIPADLRHRLLIKHVEGPLFFGFARGFLNIAASAAGGRLLVLRMDRVSLMDQSGAYALQDALVNLASSGMRIVLVGLPVAQRDILEAIHVIPDLVPTKDLFADFAELKGGAAQPAGGDPSEGEGCHVAPRLKSVRGETSLGMMWMSPVNGCSFADAGARTGKMPARRARPAAGPSGPEGGAQRAHTAVHARCVARIIKLAPRHAALLDDLPATRCRGAPNWGLSRPRRGLIDA